MLRRNGTLHGALDQPPMLPEGDGDGIEFIGKKIRELRKAKRISLAALSETTGLSIGFLSQVERDQSNPSVKALYDISRALDVNISWFFNGPDKPEKSRPGPVVRIQERKKIYFGLDVCDELLSPQSNRQLELIWSRFAPGATSGQQAYHHEGEEAGVVLSGVLELVVGEEVYRLEAGDSFGFESSIPHRYGNPGQIDTIVVWALTPPSY